MKSSPWQPLPDRRPTRASLDRDQIVGAALRISDAEGIDAVSMRRIAAEFSTGPSSLYAHVANKDELLRLMFDRIVGEIELPPQQPERWQDQLKELMRETHRVMLAHNDLSQVALAMIPNGPNALRAAEWMLSLTIKGGLAPDLAAWANERIFLYVTADAYENSIRRAQYRHLKRPKEEVERQVRGEMQQFFQSLPADRFPALSRHAEAMISGTSAARFEFGLELLVDGLTRHITG